MVRTVRPCRLNPGNIRRCAFACASSLLWGLASDSAQAFEYQGQVRSGIFTRHARFEEPIAGESTNDESVYYGQLKLNLFDFNKSQDEIVFDARDKVDNYGKLERENLRLGTYNEFQIRHLAYQRPWENNRLYFKAGRFPLREANVLANDGAEVGYRVSRDSRIGLFGGQAPKNIITPLYVDPDTREIPNTQGGLYYVYEKKEGFQRSLYTTNSFGSTPTYNLTETENHTSFYHFGLWQLSSAHRLSSMLQQDFSPESSLRRAYLTYTFFGLNLRANASVNQTNTEDYLIKQSLLDPLPPSPVQTYMADIRYRLHPRLSLDLSSSFSRRSLDSKTSSEVAFGVISPKFLLANGSIRAQYGVRDNYLSADNFARVGYDYWNQYFSLSLSHLISKEVYEAEEGEEAEEPNTRQISVVEGGFYLSESLRGSLSYQVEKDDQVTADAFFLMVGYRFGSGSVSPVRTKLSPWEEI